MLEIISAEEKRKQYNKFLEEKEKLEAEAKRERITREVIDLFNYTKAKIEATERVNYITVLITEDSKIFERYTFDSEYKKVVKVVREMLESAGYKCTDLYFYSKQWQEKSGKKCYFTVEW